MSFNFGVTDEPIGSGKRKDSRSELFSFNFGGKSKNARQSSTSAATPKRPRYTKQPVYDEDEAEEEQQEEDSPRPPKTRSKRKQSDGGGGDAKKVTKKPPPVPKARKQIPSKKSPAEKKLPKDSKKAKAKGKQVQFQDQQQGEEEEQNLSHMPDEELVMNGNTSTSAVADSRRSLVGNCSADRESEENESAPSPPKKLKANESSPKETGKDLPSENDSSPLNLYRIPRKTDAVVKLRGSRSRRSNVQAQAAQPVCGESVVVLNIDPDDIEGAGTADIELTEQATVNVLDLDSNPGSGSDDGGHKVPLKFIIEEDDESYKKLRNSDLTNNLLVIEERKTKAHASFVSPDSVSRVEEFPGVSYSVTCASNSLKIGYIKIEPKTLRPIDSMGDVHLLCWILKGSVMVRSAGGFYSKPGEERTSNYLFGKSLSTGSCIVIPPKTCYTVENWENDEALLGYSVFINDAGS